MDKNKFVAEFSSFASNYDFEDPMISLKFQHGLNVANYCMEIANFLMLTDEEKQTIFVLGLVHEIGGFEQWNLTKDFINNTQTLKILFEDKHIENYKLTPSQNKLIQLTLNLFYSYSEGMKELEQYAKTQKYPQDKIDEVTDYYKILKDANTLDFFGMLKRGSMPLLHDEDLKKTSLSRDVLQDFNSGKKLHVTQIKSNIDKVLYFTSFYFGLNFSISKVIAKKIDFTTGILHYFSSKLTDKELERVKKIIAKFLKKY